MGFKAGIYSDAGWFTCGVCPHLIPAPFVNRSILVLGLSWLLLVRVEVSDLVLYKPTCLCADIHLPQTRDAQTFSDWGIDYLKYDNCASKYCHVAQPDQCCET